MKKLGTIALSLLLAGPFAFAESNSKSSAKGSVKLKKVATKISRQVQTESTRKATFQENKSSGGKVKFRLAQNASNVRGPAQSPAQFGARRGDRVVVGGESVNPNQPLNKEKFSSSDIEEITNENFPQIIESFDYPNADVLEVVKAISELTGKNFIVDPGVRGKVTIIAPTKITVAEAYKAFLSALAINGFTVVKMGPFLKIRSARNAQRDNIETYSGDYYPTSDQMITRIIHLKHISAEEVNKQLRIIPSKDGEIAPYPPTNSLIISDYGANIDRVNKIIKQLDVPGFEEKMEVVPIRYASAKDIAELIQQILNKGQTNTRGRRTGGRNNNRGGGSFSSGVPSFGSRGAGGSKSEVISIAVPDERTNSIIVVANEAGINRIRGLVARLDFKLRPEDSGGVRVYYVKHSEAEKIAETLSGIATEAARQQQQQQRPGSSNRSSRTAPSAPASQPIFSSDVKIAADKATNSLIITASKQDYEVVLSILRKIDIPRDQVYVKAVIMEMNADNQDTFQVSYYAFDEDSEGAGRIGFNGSTNIAGLLDPQTQGGQLNLGAGDTIDITTGGTTVTVTSLLSLINFLKVHTQAQILSTPQLTATSNEEAEIEVGQDVPVSLNSTQNATGAANNVQREKATIKLKFTPYLSPDSDLVRMKVEQTIRSLSNTTVQASSLAEIAVALDDRAIKTNITVRSGSTAVLGGLIRTEIIDDERKVPFLGDLPLIGWLFKSTTKSKRRQNLIVFLTPQIIRSPDEADMILKEKLDERIGFVKEAFRGKDPFGVEMDEIAGDLYDEDEIVEETLIE